MQNLEMTVDRPLFVISDLHLGSGSPRDMFGAAQKKRLLFDFLDRVESEDGRLIVLGDLIDLWRFSLNRIVRTHKDIFDRLHELETIYIPGNHDLAVSALQHTSSAGHPLLSSASRPVQSSIGGRKFAFFHGHEIDTVSSLISPSLGKALGMSAMLIEHLKGRQIFNSEEVCEMAIKLRARIIAVFDQFAKFWAENAGTSAYRERLNRLKSDRQHKKISKVLHEKENGCHDVVVTAHTHQAGQFSDWYFNSGSWTNLRQNFLKILPYGIIEVCDWTANGPKVICNS